MRIALIWGNGDGNDAPRFHTHHYFWEATLDDCGIEWVRFSWSNWSREIDASFDLYFFVDYHPSLYLLDRMNLHPRVFFWWDAFHFPFAHSAQVTELFDQSYYAEYHTAVCLKAMGYRVEWLPPAFYPGLHRPISSEKTLDYCFIGQQDSVVLRKGDTRASLLRRLSDCSHLKGLITQGVYGEEVTSLYNQSRILFDRTIFYNIGTRLFECVGSGSFFLLNQPPKYNGMEVIGVPGIHFDTYDDSFEGLKKKIEYYLEHEEERDLIAKQGYNHFLKNHTYRNRLKRILSDFSLQGDVQ